MERILIVEDEATMARRLERVLRDEGFVVELAADGRVEHEPLKQHEKGCA